MVIIPARSGVAFILYQNVKLIPSLLYNPVSGKVKYEPVAPWYAAPDLPPAIVVGLPIIVASLTLRYSCKTTITL